MEIKIGTDISVINKSVPSYSQPPEDLVSWAQLLVLIEKIAICTSVEVGRLIIIARHEYSHKFVKDYFLMMRFMPWRNNVNT